jgi:hypothetical protein
MAMTWRRFVFLALVVVFAFISALGIHLVGRSVSLGPAVCTSSTDSEVEANARGDELTIELTTAVPGVFVAVFGVAGLLWAFAYFSPKPPEARLLSEPLRVDRMENGRRRLVRDLVIDLGGDLGLGNGKYPGFSCSPLDTTIVTVPEGFRTDFSSIPSLARPFYRFDSVDLAGCCHDLAYRVGVPRPVADRIWEIVATSGRTRVGRVRGRLGWLGLRMLGCVAYRPTGDPFDATDRDAC